MTHKSIFQEYLATTNNHHKGIYGLYLYYCYLLGVFPKKHPKQYLSYYIRQEIKKLDSFSEQTRFMVNNKIETIEDLDNFAKNNYDEYSNLMGKRENLWKRYHRAKTEDKKSEISIQDNLNNFDKDMQKEKDNSRII